MIVLRIVVGLGALALPGWLLSRRIESGARPLAAFLGSAVILFEVVLLLMLLGLPLHRGTVGCGLAAVSLVLVWMPPKWRAQSQSRPDPNVRRRNLTGIRAHLAGNWLWWVPVAFGLASIAARAVIDPLSGFDNGFRWDHLAHLMITRESLASYPPVTAAHFGLHAWCDGIPPLVSFLNFWIYATAGSTHSGLTAVRVVGEAMLIGWTVARFSGEVWGRGAEMTGVAALATSALLLWAIAMGQESALVTLSFVALLYFLFRYRTAAGWPLVFWAAVAAAMGGLSREYGLSFVLLGALLLWRQHAPSKHALLFVLVATALVAPWYIRNWVATGNPVYPQSLGGLFPTNPVHAEFMAGVGRQWSFFSSPHSKVRLAQALVLLLGFAAVVGTAGIVRAQGRVAALCVRGRVKPASRERVKTSHL